MGRHAESETFVITIYLLAFYAFVAPEICGWLIYERLKFDGGGCRDRYLKVEEIFGGITPTVKRIVVPFFQNDRRTRDTGRQDDHFFLVDYPTSPVQNCRLLGRLPHQQLPMVNEN